MFPCLLPFTDYSRTEQVRVANPMQVLLAVTPDPLLSSDL